MLDIKLKLDPKSEKYIKDMPEKAEEGLSKAMVKAMLFAEGKAKAIFKESGPVLAPPGPLVARTGHLRRSIRSGVDGMTGWIGTDVKYGAMHELGLGKMPERPFLAPSFKGKNLDKIRSIIVDKLLKEFE